VEAETLFPGQDSADSHFILTTPAVAQHFCDWLIGSSEMKGVLRPDQTYEPVMKKVFAGRSYGSKLELVYCEIPISEEAAVTNKS
jgi:hypothetical protein